MSSLNNTQVKRAPKELLRALNLDYVGNGLREGLTLSVMLEREDPSAEHKDGTDAFQRVMREAGIRTRGHAEFGLGVGTFAEFDKSDATRILGVEWLTRCWKSAATGRPVTTRGMFSSWDGSEKGVLNQVVQSSMAKWNNQLAPQIPISELVALNTGIDKGTYEAFYLTEDATQTRMVRVTEAAEIPGMKLIGGDRSVRLYKYGRKLTMTYEQMRRVPLDVIGLAIARMAVQAEVDKLATILDVIINGDGNSGTAATSYNLTTLDATAVAGTLTSKGWLNFKKKFKGAYALTTALMPDVVATALELLTIGTANVPLVFMDADKVGSLIPINRTGDGIRYGWTDDAPTLKIVGADSRQGVQRLFEIGATIQEMQRFVTNQTEALTMTESEGYAVIDPGAHKILDVNA